MENQDTFHSLLSVQDALYSGRKSNEAKLSKFAHFIEDGSEFKQALLLTVLYQNKSYGWGDFPLDTSQFIVRLQEMGLLPPDLERLHKICCREPVDRGFVLDDDKFLPLSELEVLESTKTALQKDDADSIERVNLDPQAEYFSCICGCKCMETRFRPKGPLHFHGRDPNIRLQLNLMDSALYFGAWKCLERMKGRGYEFSCNAPCAALHSCNRRRFKELGFKVINKLWFFEMQSDAGERGS